MTKRISESEGRLQKVTQKALQKIIVKKHIKERLRDMENRLERGNISLQKYFFSFLWLGISLPNSII